MHRSNRFTQLLFALAAPVTLCADFHLSLTDTAVGKNLQTFATVALSEPAPEGGLEIRLTCADASKLLLSRSPLERGAAALILKVRAGFRESPEFVFQGTSDSGSTACTASAEGYADGSGTVSLSPSAIVMIGPFRAPSFQTNVGASPVKLTLSAARLDASLNYVEEQLLALNPSIQIELTSSNKAAGTVSSRTVEMRAATSTASVEFLPGDEGETTLSLNAPGFTAPAQFAKVVANVRLPGLALSDHVMLGQNLQIAGVLSLGRAASENGTSITLTSSDPKKLVLSDLATKQGSASITLTVKKGQASANFFLQALAASGDVAYTAEGRGFRSRTATISLTPSGVVLTPASQGPPDEGQLLAKQPGDGNHMVAADMRNPRTPLVAWTVQLDPVTLRSADVTVQPLRAGMVLDIPLLNSEPTVGRMPDHLRIIGGSEHSMGTFQALRAGKTTITVGTPQGFTRSANSTAVLAVVSP